jgi:tetratricopeptide (TPR) repeat protein
VRFAQAEKSLENFRPGADLAEFIAVFTAGAPRRGARVNAHAEALAASRCRQQSAGKLWCGTCHSVHGQRTSYREICLNCHSCADARRDAQECATCHMPKFQSISAGHTTWTDHSIPLRAAPMEPSPASDLKSYYEGADTQRNLGLAYAELNQFERAWPLLRVAAESRPRDPALYTRIAMILEVDGRTAPAIQMYRRSLVLDPDQYTAVVRLAGLLAKQGNEAEVLALRRRAEILLPRR